MEIRAVKLMEYMIQDDVKDTTLTQVWFLPDHIDDLIFVTNKYNVD